MKLRRHPSIGVGIARSIFRFQRKGSRAKVPRWTTVYAPENGISLTQVATRRSPSDDRWRLYWWIRWMADYGAITGSGPARCLPVASPDRVHCRFRCLRNSLVSARCN